MHLHLKWFFQLLNDYIFLNFGICVSYSFIDNWNIEFSKKVSVTELFGFSSCIHHSKSLFIELDPLIPWKIRVKWSKISERYSQKTGVIFHAD